MRLTELLRLPGPPEILRAAFQLYPEREFLLYRGVRLNRRSVFAEIQALAAGLQNLGVGLGDRVVSLLPSCPEAVYASFLPHLLGSVNVALNPLLGEYELRHILNNCIPKVILTSARWMGKDFPAILEHITADMPDVKAILVVGDQETRGGKFLPWMDVALGGRKPLDVQLAPHNITRIIYTSGTTGWPKGAVHTRGRSWSMAVRQSLSRLSPSAMRTVLLPFPPYQFAGQFILYATLLAGGKVILADRLDPLEIFTLIQHEHVTQLSGSPTFHRLLFGSAEAHRFDISSLRRVAFASEPLPPNLAQQIAERTNAFIDNFYGASETGIISWSDLHGDWQQAAHSVGKPAPGVNVQIVDDCRHPVAPGEKGEIAVRSSQMMLGYYLDETLTQQVLDAQGWFYTGDIGAWAEDGSLQILGRKKDLIIRGGQNIYPAEIENYLLLHPDIYRVAVVGVPHAVSGEAIWAYIEMRPGKSLPAQQVLDFCRGQIAPYKIPDRVRFISQIPLSTVGKVQKYRLRELAQHEIEAAS